MIVRCLLLAVAATAICFAGCPQRSAEIKTTPTSANISSDAADLMLALESLRKLAEGNDAQPGQRTIFYLNQWISSTPAATSKWEPDRLIESIPRVLRNTPGMERLTKLQFNFDDIEYLQRVQWLDDIAYLQQNLWLHDIAERARREAPPQALRAWLKEIESSVGLPEAEQLATAERMLDWTARNIQLDALPPIPKDPLATAGSTETVLPSFRGEVGPGYAHLPLETLLYGHGDAHERARIFILLCRQVGIDAVMLGFPEEQSTARRGWLPAVFTGGKLYLYDAALGLPIPGPDGKGIATLDQVIKDPQLLQRLDVPAVATYPVTEKDLKLGVLALIDAEPAALSRRMQLLQDAMPAATRLALATRPNDIEPKLRKTNVSGVGLWSVPFEAVFYQFGQQQLAARDQDAARESYKRSVLFAPTRPLIKGRNLHLQGRYENEDQKPGARSLYLQCRPPNREIEAMETNVAYRKAIGLDQALPEDPAQKKAMLDMFMSIAREGKFDATYWLGLTYYESGKPGAATEWLTRTVQDSPPSTWIPGGCYNLARCYEQLGNFDLARQWLEADKESPQRHGNLLRAKALPSKARSGE
jgi:tetratricopeptide (TPR) repeat protein